jgi:hypothetical protein
MNFCSGVHAADKKIKRRQVPLELIAAAWGAGGTTMPLAAGGHLGTSDQELTLLVGLRALNVAMFASCFLVLWGLRGAGPPRPGSRSLG